jgi:hypothetical protein
MAASWLFVNSLYCMFNTAKQAAAVPQLLACKHLRYEACFTTHSTMQACISAAGVKVSSAESHSVKIMQGSMQLLLSIHHRVT